MKHVPGKYYLKIYDDVGVKLGTVEFKCLTDADYVYEVYMITNPNHMAKIDLSMRNSKSPTPKRWDYIKG